MTYDVFVLGSKDPSPVAQMHLAAAIASHFQVPVTQVAQAIAARNLRVGQGLDAAAAQALERQMHTFGAVPELRPNVPVRARALSELGLNPTPITGSSLLPHPTTEVRLPSLVGPVPAAQPRGGSSVDTGPLPLPHQISSGPIRVTTDVRSIAVPAGAVRDPFAPPDEHSARLELAPQGRSLMNEDAITPSRPIRSPTGASGLAPAVPRGPVETKESGLALSQDANKVNSVRCPLHGLYYDKRQASGCRKCLQPAQDRAQPGRRPSGEAPVGLRETPTKHAFLGLALALGVGFLPAAYHALRVSNKEVLDLRAQQAQLSQKSGTEATLRAFDDLDAQVDTARSHGMRNTVFIWTLLGGGVMVAWYRIT